MTIRERWYLYSDDPALALELLLRDLEQAGDPQERATLLHWLTFLGGFAEAQRRLDHEPQLLHWEAGRATLLRLRQHQNHSNPWSAVVPPNLTAAFEEHGRQLLAGDQAIQVLLQGGLGDQLETLAVMQACPLADRLEAVLPASSQRALLPLLQQSDPGRLPRWRLGEGPSQGRWLSATGLRCLLAAHQLERPVQPLSHWPTEGPRHNLLLCCWRSKRDPGEGLWAHLRSLGFQQIQGLYRQLDPLLQARRLHVLDITAYRPWEQRQLAASHRWLRFLDPRRGSLADLAAWLASSAGVLTVDTALVHLGAWHGCPTILLLHQHPDGRWRTRHDPALTVLQQRHYNRWASGLELLRAALPDWLPDWLPTEG